MPASESSNAVQSYLNDLASLSIASLDQAAAELLSGEARNRYVELAYRRGMAPLGRAQHLTQCENMELEQLEAIVHGAGA
jgi:hypothetical protein